MHPWRLRYWSTQQRRSQPSAKRPVPRRRRATLPTGSYGCEGAASLHSNSLASTPRRKRCWPLRAVAKFIAWFHNRLQQSIVIVLSALLRAARPARRVPYSQGTVLPAAPPRLALLPLSPPPPP